MKEEVDSELETEDEDDMREKALLVRLIHVVNLLTKFIIDIARLSLGELGREST